MSRLASSPAARVIAAAVPVHVALAAATDLSPDEAYYLCAAREAGGAARLVDHPPLLPWLIAQSDRLTFLPVEIRVRLWPIVFACVLSAACVELARRRGASEAGCVTTAWLGTWSILPTAGGFVATPDGPALITVVLLLLWAGGSESAAPGTGAGTEAGTGAGAGAGAEAEAATGAGAGAGAGTATARLPSTLIAAIAAGLGALAKVAVLPLALVIAATAPRRSFATRAAVLLPIALAAPLFLPSLRFQLEHAFAAPPGAPWTAGGAIGSVGVAVIAQALLWSPWVLWRGARALPRLPLPDRAAAGLLTALCVLSAIVRGVPPEPNWWAAAAIVVVVAAGVAPDLAPRRRIAMLLTAILPSVVVGAHTLHPFLPLPERADPTARLHGWSEGPEPLEAPGIGPYGPAAERCVYRQQCNDIKNHFIALEHKMRGTASPP